MTPTALPIDPDDLPIAFEQTLEERAIAEELLAEPFGVAKRPTIARSQPEPQQQLLSALAGRFLRRVS